MIATAVRAPPMVWARATPRLPTSAYAACRLPVAARRSGMTGSRLGLAAPVRRFPNQHIVLRAPTATSVTGPADAMNMEEAGGRNLQTISDWLSGLTIGVVGSTMLWTAVAIGALMATSASAVFCFYASATTMPYYAYFVVAAPLVAVFADQMRRRAVAVQRTDINMLNDWEMRNANQRLEKELDTFTAAYNTLTDQYDIVTAENNALELELQLMKARHDEHTQDFQRVAREAEKLMAENAKLTTDMVEYLATVEEASSLKNMLITDAVGAQLEEEYPGQDREELITQALQILVAYLNSKDRESSTQAEMDADWESAINYIKGMKEDEGATLSDLVNLFCQRVAPLITARDMHLFVAEEHALNRSLLSAIVTVSGCTSSLASSAP